MPGQRQPLLAWQLADISKERAEQERFFLDLQKAIDHLDHAPAGFFSADQEGRVTYINATLAEWLGIDLASFTPGATTLPEIVAGDGMALIRSVKADPGTTRNAVIDLDLATATGEALPVRFMHRVSASRDGAAGPSRTIVLNRTQGEDASAELQGVRDPLHPLLQLDADGDRRRRPAGPHRAHQRAVPVAVLRRSSTATRSTAGCASTRSSMSATARPSPRRWKRRG